MAYAEPVDDEGKAAMRKNVARDSRGTKAGKVAKRSKPQKSVLSSIISKKSTAKTRGEATIEKKSKAVARNLEKEAEINREFHAQTAADAEEPVASLQDEEPPQQSLQVRRNLRLRALQTYLHAPIDHIVPENLHPHIVRTTTEDGSTIWRAARDTQWPLDLLDKLFELAKMMHAAKVGREEIRNYILAPIKARREGSGPNADKMDQPGLVAEDVDVAIEKWHEDH